MTSDGSDDKLLTRIKRLLALTQSPNANEAASAAAEVQRLMLKHGIEEAALSGGPPPVEARDYGAAWAGREWFRGLADGVARACFCEAMYYQARRADPEAGTPEVPASVRVLGLRRRGRSRAGAMTSVTPSPRRRGARLRVPRPSGRRRRPRTRPRSRCPTGGRGGCSARSPPLGTRPGRRWPFEPRRHQRALVDRISSRAEPDDSCLGVHRVGYGKTFSGLAGIVRRLRDLKRLTPEQRQLVERVRARLVYTPESEHPTPQHAGPVLAMGVPREPCAADGQIGCPGDRGTYTRDGEIPGAAQAAPGAPLVVGLYARADVRFWQDLRTHAFPLQRQGLAQFWGCSEVPAGMPVRTYLTEQVARAAVVVVLVSADFLADAELNDLALIAMGRRKNVWPIVVRPCLLDLSPLAKLSGVQLNQGATMLDVAQQLRQRLK